MLIEFSDFSSNIYFDNHLILFKNKLNKIFDEVDPEDPVLALAAEDDLFYFIFSDEVECFFESLQKNTIIKELDCSFIKFNGQAFDFFVTGLNNVSNITCFQWEKIESHQFDALLEKSPLFLANLKGIYVSSNDKGGLTDSQLEVLLKRSKNLEYLDFSNNNLTDQCVESFRAYGKKINQLNLSNNKILVIDKFVDLIGHKINFANNPFTEKELLKFCHQLIQRPSYFLIKEVEIDVSQENGISVKTFQDASWVLSLLTSSYTLLGNKELENLSETLFCEGVHNLIKSIGSEKRPLVVLDLHNQSMGFNQDGRAVVLLALLKRFFSFTNTLEGVAVPSSFLFEDLKLCQKRGPWIIPMGVELTDFEAPPAVFYRSLGGEIVTLSLKKESTRLVDDYNKYLWDVYLSKSGQYVCFENKEEDIYIDHFFGIETLFDVINQNQKKVTVNFKNCRFERSAFETLLVLLKSAPYVKKVIFNRKTISSFYETCLLDKQLAPHVVTFGVIDEEDEESFRVEDIMSVVSHYVQQKQVFGVHLDCLFLKTNDLGDFLQKPFKSLSLPFSCLDDDLYKVLGVHERLEKLDLSTNDLVEIHNLIPLIEKSPIEHLDLRSNQATEEHLLLFMENLLKSAPKWNGAKVLLFPQNNLNPSLKITQEWNEVCTLLQFK